MGANISIPEPQPQRDVTLRELSELVSCRGEYRRDALQLIEQVRALMSSSIANRQNARGRLHQLRPEFRFSLSQSIIGGSFEKRTEVLAPDVDVVFRLNGVTPPDQRFQAVLQYFEEFLRTATQLRIIPGSIKRTNFTVGFTSYNGIEFDLLPATSITDPEEVYRIMREDRNNARYYRSSLAERQKRFMKEQSTFAHAVVRLGKLWFKLIFFGQHASAGGTFIELISVAAAMITREENGRESCFRAFWKTLKMIEDHRNIQLAFLRDAGGNWTIDATRRRGTYVMEPSDPSENLMDNDRLQNAMRQLQQIATATLARLENWNGNTEVTLVELFESHPLNVERALADSGAIAPESIYICHTQFGRNYLEVDVRKPRVLEMRQLRKIVEVLKIRVHSLLVCDGQDRRRVGARANLPEFVMDKILVWLPRANVIINRPGLPVPQLNTFDVTMSFGLGNGMALRVSVKWPDNLNTGNACSVS